MVRIVTTILSEDELLSRCLSVHNLCSPLHLPFLSITRTVDPITGSNSSEIFDLFPLLLRGGSFECLASYWGV